MAKAQTGQQISLGFQDDGRVASFYFAISRETTVGDRRPLSYIRSSRPFQSGTPQQLEQSVIR
jgi:hypothetical protein